MKIKIVFDTNFLIDIFRFKISLEGIENYLEGKAEFFIPGSVKKELEKIGKKRIKESKYAKLALKLLEKNKIRELEEKYIGLGKNKGTDYILLELAKAGYIIATNDAKLRKRIKELNAKIIYLRNKKKIEMG